MRRWIAFILLAGIVLAVAGAACMEENGGETDLADFVEAFDAGTDCPELFEIRNNMDPKSEGKLAANDQLLSAGCLSNTDQRSDSDRPPGAEGLEPINYNSSYAVCSFDSEETYRQAATDDPEDAARWLAEGIRAGVAYDSAYQGCLDGLLGRPNKFDQ